MKVREWVWDRSKQKLVPKHLYKRAREKRSHHIISDNLDGVLNPVDGQRYTSKQKYYAAVRQAGCEILGSENPSASKRTEDRIAPDIKHAIEQLRSR